MTQSIPHIPLVTVWPRLLNARLFELAGKQKRTPLEEIEMDALCRTLEAEQDNRAMPDGSGSHASRHVAFGVDGPAGLDPYRGAGE
jgi:hypothetical protein